MNMAKASEKDMEAALRLTRILGEVEKGYYPLPEGDQEAEDEPLFFDQDDHDHLRAFYERVMACMEASPGGLFRVTFGFHTLMHNDLVDPDTEHLALHPRLAELAAGVDPIRALITKHQELLADGPYAHYCYFELAFTRQTGWMAWLCSKPAEVDPERKVLAKGQGETPDEACRNALVSMQVEREVTA